jgi:aminopeptidase N
LPALATPLRYALSLDVDPSQPRFRGRATILADVPAETWHVVLHGRDLKVSRAFARVGNREIGATATPRIAHGANVAEELVLTFAEPLPAGRATLDIAYDAPFGDGLAGLYRVKDGDAWYAFTQFESTDARRAFPCFDEPAYKVPFDVSITAPHGMIAASNTPEAARQATEGGTRFDFATSPPLPSYLVAFAVGDFDVRAGDSSPVPIRLLTTKGKARLGDDALKTTRALADSLGRYFGVTYPFPKLDIVAVPDFAAGAMENPGLITFREELLLQDPTRMPMHARQRQALVIAHELAHIWFGDLVTAAWWNDVWLNEGFATWLETKAVDELDPHLEAGLDSVARTQEVMDLDALASARAVRQPVSSTDDAEDSFDQITYQKGSAVLRMIEHWIGADTFRAGVREYIRAHAWKNAKADDLLQALDKASGRDVSGMAATFLDRSGVPNVEVVATCAKQSLTFDLKQSTWHPLGTPPAAQTTPWKIPVCIHDAGAKGTGECTDLAAPSGSLKAPAPSCPAWSFPNAGEVGYYRFTLPEKELRAIARGARELDAPSRIGFVSNLWAEVRSGDVSPTVMLDALTAFDGDLDRNVVEQVTDILRAFDNTLVDDATRPAFRTYVAARMAKHKAALGWTPKPKEDASRALLRKPVLLLLGEVADDAATRKEAADLAKAWLKDPKSVDADAAPIALAITARHADAAWLEQLHGAIVHAATPEDRVTGLGALGAFGDPKVLRAAFDLLLTPDIKLQDARYVVRPVLDHRDQSLVLYGWLKDHWDEAKAKFAGGLVRRFADVAEHACTPAERDDAARFFESHLAGVEGPARPLAEALERASSCIELRSRAGGAVATRFGAAKAKPSQAATAPKK